MKGLPRKFWERTANECLKAWYERSCNPGSREYLKLNAKAEKGSAINQMIETMDAEVEAMAKQVWEQMSRQCKHMHISLRTEGSVCVCKESWDPSVCYQDRCPLLKKEG